MVAIKLIARFSQQKKVYGANVGDVSPNKLL